MIKALKKLKSKEFTVSPDLSKYIFNTHYVSYTPEKIALIGGYVDDDVAVPGTEKIQNYYRTNDRHFVSINRKIYEIIDGTLNQVSERSLSGVVHYINVLYKGKEEVYFFDLYDGFLTGGETPPKFIPPFNYYDVYDGRIFFGKNNRLYFSRDFNKKESSFDLRADYFIDLKTRYGGIAGIKRQNDKLYVFCKKSILCVQSDDSVLGIKVSETNFCGLNIRKSSVAENNGQVTFINDGQVCRFDGKKITQTGYYVSEEEDVLSLPRTNGKYYIKDIEEPFSSRCVIVVDVEEPSQFRMPIYQDMILSRENGGGVNTSNRKLVTFSPDSMPYLNGYYSTKTIKLCDEKWVMIVGISAEVKGSCNLKIRDGYNTVTYQISEEKNSIKCFHINNKIDLTFENFSQGFELKNIKIKLRTRK